MENPFRINATDETEVKCARIREVEETKRVKLRETEITKRAKDKEREDTKQKNLARDVPIQSGIALILLAMTIPLTICGSSMYERYCETKKAPNASTQPTNCVDTIVKALQSACDRSDQKLETLEQGTGTLLVCRCTHETPPAPIHP